MELRPEDLQLMPGHAKQVADAWTHAHWLMAESTDSHMLDVNEGERDSRLQPSSMALSLVSLSMFVKQTTEIYIFSVL